jgi:hypothetical protein
MSDVEHAEQISQSETSDEQALDEQGQPIQTEEDNPNIIPQKFLEASKIDVIRSYQQLEKDRGRLASEIGELRKQQEDMTEQYKQLESQRFAQPTPGYAQPVVNQEPVQQELDPFSVLDTKFDDDPKEAIREAIRVQQEQFNRQFQVEKLQQETAKGVNFYHEQKQANPDFARREPVMQRLSQQYGHIIKPEFANSVDALRALDLMSRGADLDYYKNNAVEETKKQRASIVEEKRRAQSESASSQGDAGIDVGGMTNDEYLKHMEQLYGRSTPE